MDARTWALLDRLLDEALDLPVADRAGWLDALGEEYAQVVPRLRSLLARATAGGADGLLGTIPKIQPATATGDAMDGTVALEGGATVGPYRLERVLGEGGMGAVWLAERADGVLRRQVALKVPRGAWLRDDMRERVARERDILAALNHPNIARLYDAGSTSDGQPFLALELVDGHPIDRYVAERRLDVPARLRLLLQVARAVAYAHRNLVVHRDLKPSNILVTPDGEAKLLDFGIARLLEAGQARQSDLTELSGRLLTPGFASPEQVAGESLTVATDVYSLGVVLFHLLTGVSPYRPRHASRAALEDAILHEDTVRPSDAAADPRRRRALRGDLDTILLKALKKRPEERYATIDAFADDIERHLAGLPVVARRDSTWYRVSKFVRRHALPVAVTAVALVAVLVVAVVAVWQARVAIAERRRAEEVKEFVAAIFSDANLDEEGSRSMTVLELLKQAKDRIVTLQTAPEVRVELLNLLGTSLLSLGDTETLEQVATRAAEESARSLKADDPLAVSSHLLMAWAHMYRGRPKKMQAELDRVMAVMETNPGRFTRDLATAWRLKASAAFDSGQNAEAETAAREALSRSLAAYGTRASEARNARIQLADALRRNGKVREALEMLDRVLRDTLEEHARQPLHPSVVHARAAYGRALGDNGQLAAAAEQLTLAVAAGTRLFGKEGRTVGFHLQQLAGYQLKLGQIRAAIDSSSRAVRILSTHAAPGSFTQAASLNIHGMALLAARRGKDGLAVLTQVEGAASGIFGPTHAKTLLARANRALALGYTGELSDANREIRQVVADMRKTGATIVRPLYVAGVLTRLAGEQKEAFERLEEARRLAAGKPAPKAELGEVEAELGALLLDLRPRDAEAPLRQALATLQDAYTVLTPPHADVLVALGRLKMQARRPAEALPFLEQADGFWRAFDGDNRWGGEAAVRLGQCYAALGRDREARTAFARAHGPLARSPFPSDLALARLAGRP